MSDLDFSALRVSDVSDTPMQLAEQIRASHPRLRPDVLSHAADDRASRIGAFLAAAVGRTAGVVPRFDAETHPLRVDSGGLSASLVGTVGMAFGWWVRLRTDPAPSFAETNLARRVVPQLHAVIGDLQDQLLRPGPAGLSPEERARACVVLAWCETVYRIGPMALAEGPLGALLDKPAPSIDTLLDMVRSNLAEQVLALAEIAESELVPVAEHYGVHQPLVLDREPLRAEGDLALGPTVLEIKATLGTSNRTGTERRFTLSPALIRQLVGYALLAGPDLGITGIGVYAARYGLLWVTELEPLLNQLSLRTGSLADWRAAFASLWD